MKCSFVFQFLHCFIGFLEPQKKAQTSFTQGKQIDGWLEVSDKLKGLDGRTMQGQHKSTSKMILIIIKRRMHRKISPKPLQNIRIPQQYNDKQYGNCLLVCVAPVWNAVGGSRECYSWKERSAKFQNVGFAAGEWLKVTSSVPLEIASLKYSMSLETGTNPMLCPSQA